MKYAPGDAVLITNFPHDDMNQEMMKNYGGQKMTIDYIPDRLGNFGGRKLPFYRMVEDSGTWGWTESMIMACFSQYPERELPKPKNALPDI